MIQVNTPIELKKFVGQKQSLSSPVIVTTEKLELFLDISNDRQSIHDPKFVGSTVLPANLILSLIPNCLQSLIGVKFKAHVMTVGYQKVLFKQPLHLNEAFNFSCIMTRVFARKHQVFVYYDIEITSAITKNIVMTMTASDCYFNHD